jgi:hypothetical protein
MENEIKQEQCEKAILKATDKYIVLKITPTEISKKINLGAVSTLEVFKLMLVLVETMNDLGMPLKKQFFGERVQVSHKDHSKQIQP